MKFVSTLMFLLVLAGCASKRSSSLPTDSSPRVTSENGKNIDFATYYRDVDQRPIFAVCENLNKQMLSYHAANNANEQDRQLELKMVRKASVLPIFMYHNYIPEVRAFSIWTQTIGDVKYLKDPNYERESKKLVNGLERALPEARRVDLHSYYALVLARLVSARPNLSINKDVQATCQFIESSFVKKADTELPGKMSALLRKVNVSPIEIDFDPHWKSNLSVDTLAVPLYKNTVWEIVRGG